MSDVSFPVSVPPVPVPRVAPDEGVPPVPNAETYTSAAKGESDFDYEVKPLMRWQVEDEQQIGGGGLPEGFVEQSIILVVNGEPVNGSILFKEDP